MHGGAGNGQRALHRTGQNIHAHEHALGQRRFRSGRDARVRIIHYADDAHGAGLGIRRVGHARETPFPDNPAGAVVQPDFHRKPQLADQFAESPRRGRSHGGMAGSQGCQGAQAAQGILRLHLGGLDAVRGGQLAAGGRELHDFRRHLRNPPPEGHADMGARQIELRRGQLGAVGSELLVQLLLLRRDEPQGVFQIRHQLALRNERPQGLLQNRGGNGSLFFQDLLALVILPGDAERVLLQLQQAARVLPRHLKLRQFGLRRADGGFGLGHRQFVVIRSDGDDLLARLDDFAFFQAWMNENHLAAHLGDGAPDPVRAHRAETAHPGNQRDRPHLDHAHRARLLGRRHPFGSGPVLDDIRQNAGADDQGRDEKQFAQHGSSSSM